jgi:hypothetical protein
MWKIRGIDWKIIKTNLDEYKALVVSPDVEK